MEASGVNRKEPEEEQIINCVAIFYDEGEGGEDLQEEQISLQSQGLGILLWCCCKTTYCTPRDHYGSTWDTPRVYASKAMQSRREANLRMFPL